ncbi:MAG: hypothetical protein CVU60_13675 [Deltaproteobacteria bacterium HGW-Deltaproteobacteria-18]|nr:MAG: hypothetical protein CVU60_13675 [Deltaproteobacteria bacterium HGW-Deltaproteobacteria-18]
MAHIHDKATQGSISQASAQRKDILLRIIVPLVLVLILGAAGLFAFRHGLPWVTALFAVFFIAAILRFEEIGLTLAHYPAHSQTNARAEQIVGKTLRELPDEYHIFHNLHFDGNRLDHAVIGPNGLFLIRTRSHVGNVMAAGEALRLNGWPFLLDMLTQCWNLTQKLTRHLDLQYAGGVHPCPVLCFSRASVGIAGPVRGTLVVEAGNLVQAILTHEDALPAEKMHVLIDKLSGLVSSDTGSQLHGEDVPQASHAPKGPAESSRPVCTKCRHQPSREELELFPGECPKCGLLYSFKPDESLSAPQDPPAKGAWKPSLLHLGMAVVLIAGSAGYFAHRQGLLGLEKPFTESNRMADAKPEASATPGVPVQNGTSASAMAEQPAPDGNHTTPPQAKIVSPAPAPGNGTAEGGTALPVFSRSNDGATPPTTESDLGTNSSVAVAALSLPKATAANAEAHPNATLSNTNANSGDTVRNSTAPGKKDSKPKSDTAKEAPKAPEGSFDKGRLVVTSSRPLVLWFRNQQTYKEFGPFEIKARSVKDIVLPKGFYSVVYLENGKRRQTTMSFLSDQGQLEF